MNHSFLSICGKVKVTTAAWGAPSGSNPANPGKRSRGEADALLDLKKSGGFLIHNSRQTSLPDEWRHDYSSTASPAPTGIAPESAAHITKSSRLASSVVSSDDQGLASHDANMMAAVNTIGSSHPIGSTTAHSKVANGPTMPYSLRIADFPDASGDDAEIPDGKALPKGKPRRKGKPPPKGKRPPKAKPPTKSKAPRSPVTSRSKVTSRSHKPKVTLQDESELEVSGGDLLPKLPFRKLKVGITDVCILREAYPTTQVKHTGTVGWRAVTTDVSTTKIKGKMVDWVSIIIFVPYSFLIYSFRLPSLQY